MKSAPIPPELTERLARSLAETGGVLAAYVFGSQVLGRGKPSSDIDIAVLLEQPTSVARVGAVLKACQDVLSRNDVDLVVLNTATPILAFEAVSGNRILADPLTEVAAFESLAAREYEDEMARLRRASRYPAA